jgi:hypothetical protein
VTDYRRLPDPAAPIGTTVIDAPGLDDADVRTALRWVRTAISAAFGLVAACWLGLAVVVALTAQHALVPERPLAAVSVALSVPELRADLADDMVDDLEQDGATTFAPQERAELAEALEAVLGSDELLDQLAALPVVDGRIDGAAVMDTISRELRAQAASRPARVRVVLERAARQLPEVAETEGTTADVSDMVGVIAKIRRFAFIAAAGLLVPALVCGAVAVGVARRRGLAAALVLSGGLLLATTVLAPGRFVLDHLPGPLSLPGAVLAGLGTLVGSGWLWTIALLALVPPIVWWARGSLGKPGTTDEVAGPHWVP